MVSRERVKMREGEEERSRVEEERTQGSGKVERREGERR